MSTTCSATTGRHVAKNWRTSASCSTMCSTGTSRFWASSYPMPACRCTCSCGRGSSNAAGRSPPTPVGLPSSEESSQHSATPTLVLVTVFWPLGASFLVSTFGYEWWDTVASTAAIDIRSCRHHRSESSLPPPFGRGGTSVEGKHEASFSGSTRKNHQTHVHGQLWVKMCVFVSRPMNIVTFLLKKRDPAKRVVDFPVERDTFRNKIMEIVKDF